MKHTIEFVSYDGTFPCLCMGTLKVKIDGKKVIFSDSAEYCECDGDELIYKENCYPQFWETGGAVKCNDYWDMWTVKGDWKVFLTEAERKCFTPELIDMLDDLIKVFNENVPQGCCGGCI